MPIQRIIVSIILASALVSTAFSQRPGAIDTGGFFAFRSIHTPDSTSSTLDIDWSFGFYRSKDFFIELQPGVQLDMQNKNYVISSQIMGAASVRLFDLTSGGYGYEGGYSSSRDRSRRVTAGVFGFLGVGMWVDGFNRGFNNSNSSIGPAFSLGFTSQSLLSTSTLIKTRIQYVYLAPAGDLYNSPRSVFKIGVGFSFFLVM